MSNSEAGTYAEAGVDTKQADEGLSRLTARIRQTWPPNPGLGAVKLDLGYFANVIDIGGTGLAITADGVGTKVLIAQMMNKYDTVGIDCVAMNVNDLLCVGARPLSLVDIIAVEAADPDVLDALSVGLCAGAALAGVSIPGGEIAQVRELVRGVRDGSGFDLSAAAVGTVPLDKILVGQDVVPSDIVIGVESSGVHSNGLTLARRVLLPSATAVGRLIPELGCTVGEELLRPTHIYVREALDLLDQGVPVRAFLHLTGDGFLNLPRVAAEVGFVIDSLPPPKPIFSVISARGEIPAAEMYEVFNMGIGFCIIVPPEYEDQVIATVGAHGKAAWRIGFTVADPERRVTIVPEGLVGRRGGGFRLESELGPGQKFERGAP